MDSSDFDQMDDNGVNGAGGDQYYRNAGNGAPKNDEAKLFVGGLSWETQQKDLKDYFSKFGEVQEVNLKIDPTTGRSRGFAFVQFTSADAVGKVVSGNPHTINNKQVDAKRANPKPLNKKIFIGGLDPEFSEDELRKYFSQYGAIENVELPYDKLKNQRRQFAFLTFESEEAADAAVANPKQMIGTKECDLKKATPPNAQGFGGRGGFGGAGGFGGEFGGRGRGARGGGRGGGYGGGWNQGQDSYGSYGQGGYGSYGAGGYGAQSGYGQGSYGSGYGYSGYGAGYDYSGYGAGLGGSYGGSATGGTDSYVQNQEGAGYGKSKRGSGYGGQGYHPYS